MYQQNGPQQQGGAPYVLEMSPTKQVEFDSTHYGATLTRFSHSSTQGTIGTAPERSVDEPEVEKIYRPRSRPCYDDTSRPRPRPATIINHTQSLVSAI
mmetsp:Transcript_30253/g.59916  ORF Transcript_30253/g.59916 Transcript_30253/m.59916 type:complete len:98 (-) Transcript_30253:334-627(-)